MPRVHEVKKARKTFKSVDDVEIKKGDTYYWWKFRYGPIIKSFMYPDRRQLTRSSYLISMYDIEDEISSIVADESISDQIQEIISNLECLRDEQQESLDNMPEHLQDSSSSGQMLQERIDSLENTISEFENIDIEVDDGLKEKEKQESYEEILGEIQNISLKY